MKAYLTDEQQQREYLKLDKERNPAKWKARRAVRAAVEWGKLDKPTVCSVNNEDCSPGRINGHHDDYDKPLEVRWFCNNHHSEVHNGRLPK